MNIKHLLSIPLLLLVASFAYLSAEENSALQHLENIKEIITSGLSSKKDEPPKYTKIENWHYDSKRQDKKDIINLLLKRKSELDESLKTNNIWAKIYSNYHTYLYLIKEQAKAQEKIKSLENRRKISKKESAKLIALKGKSKTIEGKLQLLEEYKKDPFKELIKPMPLEEIPSVTNPVAIITAVSYKKKLLSEQEAFNSRYRSLKQIVDKFQEESKILEELVKLDSNNKNYMDKLKSVNEKLKIYKPVLDIFKTTKNVYNKKVDEIKLKLRSEIKKEISKAAVIGGIILFFFALFLLSKFLARKYMAENDRFYMINKILNITFIMLLVVILVFSYIENVSYLVTVLGFASAGIAIAMKDWFMSLMGWFVIIIGGTIHVGDRVKFVKDGVEYVGDIVDISVMRMTLHEDVTLTTYMHNRRGGRMVFIPNNFIFTDMIANYSHSGLKTVWDGIDFVITFDSDISKATSIAKEVTKKYSKGYTDITRKQLNKLRSSYSIRNTNVEPRILSFIEPYGMKISSWYLTNAYATLTLRSTISQEIIERIQAEENVHLAFPTQSIYVDKDVRKPAVIPEEIEPNEGVTLS